MGGRSVPAPLAVEPNRQAVHVMINQATVEKSRVTLLDEHACCFFAES